MEETKVGCVRWVFWAGVGLVDVMPAEWDGDRQRLKARARRKMGLWAMVSGCMVATALYGSALAHRKVQSSGFIVSFADTAGKQYATVVSLPPRYYVGLFCLRT